MSHARRTTRAQGRAEGRTEARTEARPLAGALLKLSVTLLVTVLTCCLVPGAAAHATEEDPEESTPLSVVLTSMSPPEIPRSGVISLTGVVANNTGEAWTDVNVAPFVSSAPITSRDELATAAATEPDVAVGERLTTPGTTASVGDLEPGESATFLLRVRRSALAGVISGDPGVYWIGVHALGANADGRDLVADGRARTFIPLVTPAAARRTTSVSLVLPLRERARRAEDGSLKGPARWASLTGPEGRLTRVADFGASAGSAAVSWLVDPAVLDALEDFGRGNPPLSLGSQRRADDTGDPDDLDAPDDPTESPSGSTDDPAPDDPAPDDSASDDAEDPSPSAGPSAGSERTGTPSAPERARATAVLQTFLTAARGRDLLTLGYADPDVAALTRRSRPLARRAAELATRRMTARELTGRATVAPPDGFFDPDLLDKLPKDTVLALTDRGRLTSPVLSRLPSGQELLLGDERAATGGPSPSAPLDPLALRQRILAESALEITSGVGTPAPRPVVVVLPPSWDPGPRWRQADFFGGIASVNWLRLAPVPRTPSTAYDGKLSYTRAQQAEEIGPGNIEATRTLTRTSTVLSHLLANSNDVDDRLTGAALQASSYSARPTRRLAADLALALDATARNKMDRVMVTGTDFVTLSGGSGSLTVTLVNGLAQPITVGLRARTDDTSVEVEAPDPVEMQPGQRTTLRLQVSSGVGVHNVTLYPVTTEGEETGTPLTFSLRTSQVGRLIWYIIVAGGALLAVMIVRRIVQRVRSHRWREEPTS